jgi:hypothetical protein
MQICVQSIETIGKNIRKASTVRGARRKTKCKRFNTSVTYDGDLGFFNHLDQFRHATPIASSHPIDLVHDNAPPLTTLPAILLRFLIVTTHVGK